MRRRSSRRELPRGTYWPMAERRLPPATPQGLGKRSRGWASFARGSCSNTCCGSFPRPGEQSGAFRIPDVNQGARNYYLIVEAVSPDGTVLSMPVVNEENGKTETATKWGIRVPQSTFEAVRRDKNDDGIIQNNKLAEKRRGELDPTYLMPVLQGTITRW